MLEERGRKFIEIYCIFVFNYTYLLKGGEMIVAGVLDPAVSTPEMQYQITAVQVLVPAVQYRYYKGMLVPAVSTPEIQYEITAVQVLFPAVQYKYYKDMLVCWTQP